MIKNLMTGISLLLISSCFGLSEAQVCDEPGGTLAIENGDNDEAFRLLKGCEGSTESAATLMQLAVLYGYLEYGEFDSISARVSKFHSLNVAAALKGNEDAILYLIDVFEEGVPLISLASNKVAGSCLQQLIDSAQYKSTDVALCLSVDAP